MNLILLCEKWPQWGQKVPLVVLDSPYRSTVGPLLDYLDLVDKREPERGLAVVVLPEFVPARWWHELLHNQTARAIKHALTIPTPTPSPAPWPCAACWRRWLG